MEDNENDEKEKEIIYWEVSGDTLIIYIPNPTRMLVSTSPKSK